MSRSMTSAMLAFVEALEKRPVLLFEGDFASGSVYLFSGIGTLTWGAKTFSGAGDLAKVESIGESTDIVAQGAVFTLSGVPSSVISLIESEVFHGQTGKLWLGALDTSGALIADPILLFSGNIDQPQLIESAAGPQVQITYENVLIDITRARQYNYASADQQQFYPGDQGFDYVPSIQNFNGTWGS